MSRLILASASPTRARLLSGAGLDFEIRAADIDEDALKAQFLAEDHDAASIAAALAERKALAVSQTVPDALVLGADQVLEFEGRLVSKSPDLAAAKALLRALRGRTHKLISAAVLARAGAPLWSYTATSLLTMRAFSDGFLASYLEREGEGLLSGVGCYRLEGRGVQLFESIKGGYFSILGLPLLPLLAVLRDQGAIGR